MRKSLDQIKFTGHAVQRMFERRIQPSHIRTIVESGEVISDYPNDVPFPSCLILGFTSANRPLHLQCSYPTRPLVVIITLYEPDPRRWDELRTRRRVDEL